MQVATRRSPAVWRAESAWLSPASNFRSARAAGRPAVALRLELCGANQVRAFSSEATAHASVRSCPPQRLVARRAVPEQARGFFKHGVVEAVENYGLSAASASLPGNRVSRGAGLKCGQVDEADAQFCLLRQMQAQIGLSHRRHRDDGAWSDGGRCDTIPPSASAKRLPKTTARPRCGAPTTMGTAARTEDGAAQLHRAADAADLRRTVKGGTDLVVIHGRAEPAHGAKDRGQIRSSSMQDRGCGFRRRCRSPRQSENARSRALVGVRVNNTAFTP